MKRKGKNIPKKKPKVGLTSRLWVVSFSFLKILQNLKHLPKEKESEPTKHNNKNNKKEL